MGNLSETRKGEFFVFTTGFFWSFFPIITVLTYSTLQGLASLAWSNLFATLFFAGAVTYRKKWSEFFSVQLLKYALMITLFNGVLYYAFVFIGLESTTPGNMMIIGLFEIFTSFMLFHLILKDHFSLEHKVGALFMVAGAVIILIRDFSGINTGDLLIFAAMFFAPFGNMFSQKARRIASSEMILFLRCLLSTPALFLLAYILDGRTSLPDVRISLPFLLVNGLLILGLSKIFWIEAIHRISVTKAQALSSLNPFLTLIFAWIILNQAPAVWQIVSLIPLVVGIMLLTDQFKLRTS